MKAWNGEGLEWGRPGTEATISNLVFISPPPPPLSVSLPAGILASYSELSLSAGEDTLREFLGRFREREKSVSQILTLVCHYSGTSDNVRSEKRTTSVEQTNCLQPIVAYKA